MLFSWLIATVITRSKPNYGTIMDLWDLNSNSMKSYLWAFAVPYTFLNSLKRSINTDSKLILYFAEDS